MVKRVLALLATVFGSSLLITTIYAVGMGCAPGTFITDTGCQRCPNGTFTDKFNATKCSQCDRCNGRHNEITKVCTSSSNTECSCQSGYYFDGSIVFCEKCSQCKRGRGVVRNCTATSNTVCKHCVKGKTFSSEKNMEECKPCTRCPKGHIVQQECTRRTDTVCVPEKDINNSKYPKQKITSSAVLTTPPTRNRTTTTKRRKWPSSPKRPTTESISVNNHSVTPIPVIEDHTTDSDDNTDLQIVLYSLIGLLVLLVAVLTLICWRCKKRNRPRKKPKPGNNSEEPSTRSNSTDIIEAVENPYSSLPLIGVRQGSEKMLRDVPYTLINELSQYLNPGDRWKHLGGHLHFNTTQISNFAVDRSNATQVMLQEWGQKDGATVGALQSTFRKMKWTKEEKIVGQYV
ncbi:tumor necrosis factor receptor superfamily member 16-like isoform X1 [Oculina patagonica]